MSLESMAPAQSKWAISAGILLLGAALTGCANHATFQDVVANQAQNGQFTLPRGEGSGAPMPEWDAMFLAWPYSDTNDVPEPFTKAARALNTSSTDSVQWLLFAEGSNVKRISIDRSAIDFCLDGAVNAEYQHAQMWNAEKSDGAWLMTAVGPQPGS